MHRGQFPGPTLKTLSWTLHIRCRCQTRASRSSPTRSKRPLHCLSLIDCRCRPAPAMNNRHRMTSPGATLAVRPVPQSEPCSLARMLPSVPGAAASSPVSDLLSGEVRPGVVTGAAQTGRAQQPTTAGSQHEQCAKKGCESPLPPAIVSFDFCVLRAPIFVLTPSHHSSHHTAATRLSRHASSASLLVVATPTLSLSQGVLTRSLAFPPPFPKSIPSTCFLADIPLSRPASYSPSIPNDTLQD